MSITRRSFLVGSAVLWLWLTVHQARAHHKPGHKGGPKPSSSPTPTPNPDPLGQMFMIGISALRDGSLLRAA